jgi:hypothetical protein
MISYLDEESPVVSQELCPGGSMVAFPKKKFFRKEGRPPCGKKSRHSKRRTSLARQRLLA